MESNKREQLKTFLLVLLILNNHLMDQIRVHLQNMYSMNYIVYNTNFSFNLLYK